LTFCLVDKVWINAIRGRSVATWRSIVVLGSCSISVDPIRVDAMSTPHSLADSDGKVAGIRWKPEYYETHIDFEC
jgi:hypothetical protein